MIQENGKIYKYTNKINGKIYIGQTKLSLHKRHLKHLTENDNTYFHRALRKYGEENFTLELIEDYIPFNDLDKKEKYYINYYDSFYTTGKGYNLTQGGKWGSGTQKLTIRQAEDIKQILLTTKKTFLEIAKEYNVSIYCISDINTGKSFKDPDIKYPLRPSVKKSVLDAEKVDLIISLLQTTNLTQKQIADSLQDVTEYTIGEINRGYNSWCPKELNYPIRKAIQKNTYMNKLQKEEAINICYDLCFSALTQKEIGKKYGVATNTIGDISRGVSWKEITNQFVCPIRKNKIENQKIYTSIYGIV